MVTHLGSFSLTTAGIPVRPVTRASSPAGFLEVAPKTPTNGTISSNENCSIDSTSTPPECRYPAIVFFRLQLRTISFPRLEIECTKAMVEEIEEIPQSLSVTRGIFAENRRQRRRGAIESHKRDYDAGHFVVKLNRLQIGRRKRHRVVGREPNRAQRRRCLAMTCKRCPEMVLKHADGLVEAKPVRCLLKS